MKKILTFVLAACLLLSLAACGKKDAGNQNTEDQQAVTEQNTQQDGQEAPEDQDAPEEQGTEAETQTISGVVNRLDGYLVLLDDKGDYHIFDFGDDVDQSSLEEGDKIVVTYTGTLDSENPAPVAVSVQESAN